MDSNSSLARARELRSANSDRITVRLPESHVEYIDMLIEEDIFETRSQAIRYSVIEQFMVE